jgi:hypothetical protein
LCTICPVHWISTFLLISFLVEFCANTGIKWIGCEMWILLSDPRNKYLHFSFKLISERNELSYYWKGAAIFSQCQLLRIPESKGEPHRLDWTPVNERKAAFWKVFFFTVSWWIKPKKMRLFWDASHHYDSSVELNHAVWLSNLWTCG